MSRDWMSFPYKPIPRFSTLSKDIYAINTNKACYGVVDSIDCDHTCQSLACLF